MIKEIIIYLIRALNPVAFRRDRARQIQMLKQINKYLRIALNPIAFERGRVKQIQARDKQIQARDKQIQAKDRQIQALRAKIEALSAKLRADIGRKDKRIELLRGKVEALRRDHTKLLAHIGGVDASLEHMSCLGDSKPERQAVYRKLLGALSNDGYGYDYAFTGDQRHHPMAYALVASAEAYRYLMTEDEEALTRAIHCADWLVANSDLNNDGLWGWGLAFPWDAFQDGPPNPAHTQYAITTALCAKALLDTYDAIGSHRSARDDNDTSLPEARYLEVGDTSMHSFIQSNAYNTYTDSKVAFWYSLRPEDSYEAINIQAMFAGILQRLSTYPIDSSRVAIYAEFADRVMSYIMDCRQEYAGGWLWSYLGHRAPLGHEYRLNDTVHAAYTVDGLMTYKIYGGGAADDIDDAKLLAGLAAFLAEGKVVHLPGQETPARLWGVGYLLYVLSHHFDAGSLANSVYAYAMTDLWANALFWYGEEDDSDYVRDQTHMLIGLSYYAYKSQ